MTSADQPGADLEAALAQLAEAAGGTLHAYPRPGRAVRRVILRDLGDERGTQFEAAQVEDDGTLRVTGHDTGPAVSAAFGSDITSYEWVYVIPPDRVDALLLLLGGAADDDVLALLAAHYERTGGLLSDLLRHPDIAADFSTWHS